MAAQRRLRTLLATDASVSEVLGTVLLTASTVVLLGGFAVVLLSSLDDTDDPPSGSFALQAAAGDASVRIVYVDGAPFPLDGARVVLLVNDTDLAGTRDLLDPAVAGTWSPGGALRVNLSSGALAAEARLLALVVDLESGKPIGTTRATALTSASLPAFVASEPSITAVAVSPSVLTVDGASLANITVNVSATHGLGLVRSVVVDLSAIGGPAEAELRDDGMAGDALAGDGTYTLQVSAASHGFAVVPSVETVQLPVTVRDVLGKTAASTLPLPLQPAPLSKVAAGARWRDLPASGEVRWINLTNVTFRDAAALDNDQAQIRVSDLAGTSAWTALVSFGSPLACGGQPGVTAIQLSRDGVAGSVTYQPSLGACLSLGSLTQVNLADVTASLDAAGAAIAWTLTGAPGAYVYSAAGIGASNEAVVVYLGDSVSPAPSALGLGQADLTWARVTGNLAPAASFTASVSGLGLDVDAAASSDPEGGALAYAWEWGDGASGTGGPAASHTYAAAGNYTVNLTVTDPDGATGATSRLVSVNRPPVASFTTSTSGIQVDVDSAASGDPDGQPIVRAWQWGDGTGQTGGVTASHTYAASGTYQINLTVTDTFGATHTASATVVVLSANLAPTASLSANATSGAAPLDVRFSLSGSDSDGTIASWTLQHGDGTSATGTSLPTTRDKQYAAGGTYQANLTVTDDDGASHTASVTLSVNARPVASFVVASTTGLIANVDGGASSDADGAIASYQWEWGDGTTTTTGTPTTSHTYAAAGAYAVNLTVTDNLGATSAKASRTATVNRDPVIGGLATTRLDDLNATLSTSATDPDGQPLTYTYAWGDATNASARGSDPVASHTYAAPGNYTVTVYANDTLGGSASATTLVQATSTLYALLATTDAGTPGGTITDVQNIQAADGASATLTEASGSGATATQPAAACDRTFDGCGSTTWTLVSGSFSTPGISGSGTGSTLSGGTSGNALVLATSGAGPAGLRSGTYQVQWTQTADASAGTGSFSMGYRFQTTTAGQSVTMVLVAPSGAVTTLGTANVANANWNLFTGASVPSSVTQQGGTFTLYANVTIDKNTNVMLDDVTASWTGANTHRFQKQLSVTNLPSGALSHHLEVRAAQGANPETLLLLVEGPSGTWTQRGSFTSTSPATAVYKLTAADLIGNAVNLRLVDATTASDAAQSAWTLDYVRVVVRGA